MQNELGLSADALTHTRIPGGGDQAGRRGYDQRATGKALLMKVQQSGRKRRRQSL